MTQAQQSIETVKQAVDGTLGAGAVSAPFWVGYIETGLTMFMLAGGALLLALRLFLTVKEIRKKKKED
jgi:hypothetical protein